MARGAHILEAVTLLRINHLATPPTVTPKAPTTVLGQLLAASCPDPHPHTRPLLFLHCRYLKWTRKPSNIPTLQFC